MYLTMRMVAGRRNLTGMHTRRRLCKFLYSTGDSDFLSLTETEDVYCERTRKTSAFMACGFAFVIPTAQLPPAYFFTRRTVSIATSAFALMAVAVSIY